ncbi:MAG: hypothetical protein BMS9Abin02_0911 [Anaerolineae bacterium]|nr:MAG: hypothetical protein BMS9Abin02_0911 [Anaerolineae bacterium]
MRRIVMLGAIMLLLAACQDVDMSEGPQTILDWQPTPYGDRPPLTAVTFPTPPGVEPRPELPPTSETIGLESLDVPELAPTLAPENIYVSLANGFAVPFPSSWQIQESGDQNVRIYDPSLNVTLFVSSDFQDDETSYQSSLDIFLDDEDGFFGQLEVTFEEQITFAGDGMADTAFLTGQDEKGKDIGVWLAYAEDKPRTYLFTAVGDSKDLEARQATLKAIISQVEPGGRLIYNLERKETLVLRGGDPIPIDLDPARQGGSAAGYIGLLYSGLVRLSPDLQVEPDLAQSWTVSEDGTVYTFTLRDDLKFHSGKSITATDFQYSWERAADPKTDSTTAATYLGDILGVPEKLNGSAETIEGVEVVDDRTLVVTLDSPKPYFLLKLTYPTSFVVDEGSVDLEDEEWVFQPNASGPYTLMEVHEEAALIFERNENYHTLPSIPYVIYLLYRIGSPISLFESGELDQVYVWGEEAKRVSQPGDELHDQWVSTTGLNTGFVALNNTMPPMDDPDVRRAFALAVNKEALNELVNEGTDLVAETILPPAMPGFSQELVEEMANQSYDPEAARAALANSAYADGLPPITLTVAGYGTTDRDDVNALVAGWQEVLGVEVNVEYLDPEDFTRAARQNHGHMVVYGWNADYPDPENFLDTLFHSDSEFNVSGYSNPEIDALLEAARTEQDPGRRLALYQEIEAMLLADGAAIPLDHSLYDALVSPRLNGFVLAPSGVPIIHRLSLEPIDEGE